MTEELDLATFQDRLGRELVAAAHRRMLLAADGRPSRLPIPSPAALIAAAAVLAIAIVGAALMRPGSAVAEIFVVTRLDGGVQLDVVDIVSDPRRVEQQLATKLGLDATLVAVPAAPELEGQLVVAGHDGSIAPEVELESGRIIKVILPEGFHGSLVFEYGRPAEPGEIYKSTITDPVCADFWATTASESLDEVTELADTVRYETMRPDYQAMTDVSPQDIDPEYRLVDITYLSSNEVVVTYAARIDGVPRHPNCR